MSQDDAAADCCPWALGVSEAYRAYHDDEWGVPVHDDRTLFEFLVLETAQAGLSWATILHKRAGYREAFADFDVERVARFDDARAETLRQNPGIVRNKAKIASAIGNAQRFIGVQQLFGSFDEYLWAFVDNAPIHNKWRTQSECPATSDISDALSADLRQRGFKFVGSTTMYAYMQAVGLINDHIVGCERHDVCAALGNAA